MIITAQEYGWPVHFSEQSKCRFRRNTTLTADDGRILIVSSVGHLIRERPNMYFVDKLRGPHYYETMTFEGRKDDDGYVEAKNGVEIDSWGIDEFDDTSDLRANDLHEHVVNVTKAYFDKIWERTKEAQDAES